MAEPLFIGAVYVWGLDGNLAYTGMAVNQNEPQKLSYQDDISRHNSKDRKGQTIGVQLYDPNPKASVTFMPRSAATGAGQIALAKNTVVLPARGSKVTLSGFPPNPLTAEDVSINSAKWIYLGGGSIDSTNEGEVTMTLPLERFGSDLATDNS